MDPQKPNHRPGRKNGLVTRDTLKLHARKQHQRLTPSTLVVHARGNEEVIEANGESFRPGVEYSLNKGRRWELRESDFVEPESDDEPTPSHKSSAKSSSHASTASKKAVVIRTKDADAKSELASASTAFFSRSVNKPVDEEPSDSDEEMERATASRRKLSRKDRKAQRAVKPKKLNTELHNTHSSSVYAAASADVYVAITETPKLAKIRPLKTHKEGREIQARTHKNQDLARMGL